MARDDRVFLRHIGEAGQRIVDCLSDVEEAEFRGDWMLQDVVCRELEIMGEAAIHVSDSFQKAHPEIPWRSMVGTRNRLIHAYASVDLGIVWEIARSDVPRLLDQVQALLKD